MNRENPDADNAAKCIVGFDSSTTKVDDEYVDTIEVKVSKDCIRQIIEDKLE